MPDTYETALPVNNILDNLKDHIIANGGNDNFVSNQELNLTSAKVVFNWLEKLFKDSMTDTEGPQFKTDAEKRDAELKAKSI
ncbi:hypothetical protein CEXT_486981 [Caerostris extrusa]|uniref:Uncharacterized protein n=1 Tax=Caerostris extrusa TaxID=172846 RepID=A0AAV4QNF0_CAEEX|nr:hypothetical protein CEXT_486981 [Caerostris extrusa]